MCRKTAQKQTLKKTKIFLLGGVAPEPPCRGASTQSDPLGKDITHTQQKYEGKRHYFNLLMMSFSPLQSLGIMTNVLP